MKIIALCKTFRGEEWLEPMILSIYPYVEKIVFVNSHTSWNGRIGNSCIDEIERIKQSMDSKDKLVSVRYDTINQADQCMHGYRYIQENFPCDYILHIDTDEIWDGVDLQRAIEFVKENPHHQAYRSSIYTYIKSPLYRVTPIEQLQPVVFTNASLYGLGDSDRSCDLPYALMQDDEGMIPYHHFIYVRDTFNSVLEKIVTSHVAENVEYQEMDKWIPEVWNCFPKLGKDWLKGFHPNKDFQTNWMGVEHIDKKRLPKVLRENNFPILEKFEIRN
jgi:hypothetical protein